MKTILMVCPNYYDATSWYRGMRPFQRIKRETGKINLAMVTSVDWSVLGNCDLLFLQRPYTEAHLKLATLATQMNVPIWVDFDDFLFEMPTDNPVFNTYSTKEVQKRIAEITAMA